MSKQPLSECTFEELLVLLYNAKELYFMAVHRDDHGANEAINTASKWIMEINAEIDKRNKVDQNNPTTEGS